nr:immunoglobulin light chain junction region [Macaca mulatta]
GQQGYTYPYSF